MSIDISGREHINEHDLIFKQIYFNFFFHFYLVWKNTQNAFYFAYGQNMVGSLNHLFFYFFIFIFDFYIVL